MNWNAENYAIWKFHYNVNTCSGQDPEYGDKSSTPNTINSLQKYNVKTATFKLDTVQPHVFHPYNHCMAIFINISHLVQYCIKLKSHLDFVVKTQADIVGASKPWPPHS
jgi:hypothetical protein